MSENLTAPAEIKETSALTTEPTARPNPINEKVIKGRERAQAKADGKPFEPILNEDPNKPLSPRNDGKLTLEKVADGKSNKVFIPFDTTKSLGALGALTEVVKESKSNK